MTVAGNGAGAVFANKATGRDLTVFIITRAFVAISIIDCNANIPCCITVGNVTGVVFTYQTASVNRAVI